MTARRKHRKWRLALIALFLAILFWAMAREGVFGAVETTTVQGRILLPNGQPATSGTITASLSAPGTAEDPAIPRTQTVGGRFTGTIGTDGTITGLVLIPNDAITPSTTHYNVTINVRAPERMSWTEKWTLDTAPDPVDVGDITTL